MESFWKLFTSRIKMFVRDRRSLFWTIFFPIMFILIFGLFDFDKMSQSSVTIFNNSNSEVSQTFSENLSQLELFKINSDYSTVDEAKEAVLESKLDFVFVIPADFDLVNSGKSISPVEVYYDKTNVQLNGIVFSVLKQYLDQMNMQISQTPQVFSYETKELQTKEVNYLDVIVPGILGMSIMQGGLFSIALGIVRFREKGVLRKFMSTPLRIRYFMLALILSYILISMVQVTFILLLSKFVFHVNIYGSIPLMYGVFLLGQIIFLSLGFAIAGISKTTDMAQGMVQALSMPMMFLSGVFFSPEALPSWVKAIVDYLPLTPFIEALRKISLQGGSFPEIQKELLFMTVWALVASFLAWRNFKFERE